MSDPLIVGVDAEVAILTYLRTRLSARPEPYTDNVLVCATLPKRPPERVVWVRKLPSSRRNLVVDSVPLTVDVFAKTKADRFDLTAMVEGLILACSGQVVGDTTLYRPETISGPQEGPNPFEPDEVIGRLTMSVGIRRKQLG